MVSERMKDCSWEDLLASLASRPRLGTCAAGQHVAFLGSGPFLGEMIEAGDIIKEGKIGFV